MIGTASTPARRELVSALGADAVIDHETADSPDQVLALTGGRGVDVLIESIGGAVFEQNFDALAPFGRCLLLGWTRGPGKPLEPRMLMTRSQALIGFYLPVFYDTSGLVTSALQYLRDGLESSGITAPIDAVLPLSAAADAHRRIENRDVHGVIVLDPDDLDAKDPRDRAPTPPVVGSERGRKGSATTSRLSPQQGNTPCRITSTAGGRRCHL